MPCNRPSSFSLHPKKAAERQAAADKRAVAAKAAAELEKLEAGNAYDGAVDIIDFDE